jgi:hypothetical protein
MGTAISDEPRLDTVSDCLDEFNKCIRWERHHQEDYDEWLRENPEGNTRAMLAIVAYWRERRLRVEARFKELNDLVLT